ncbi:MAG: hypothetical protein PWR07_2078 [Bacillota bacterium]|nr:hypothetical protein [Bacillota bacterium]
MARRGRGAAPGPLPGGRKTGSYGEDIVPSTAAAVEEEEESSVGADVKHAEST